MKRIIIDDETTINLINYLNINNHYEFVNLNEYEYCYILRFQKNYRNYSYSIHKNEYQKYLRNLKLKTI